MDKYADGVKTEVDTGYKVTVSKVFEVSGTADESGDFVVLPEPGSYVKDNTQYLVTLDVNGVNKLYRELWTSGDADDNNVVPLGDYTYTMDENSINGLTEDDAVVVRFEEVEVKTSDAFRAAVSKTAPEAPSELPAVAAADKGKFLHANESTGAVEWAEGGGSGGGVLVVGCTASGELGNVYTLDKTWQEIQDADYPVVVMRDEYGNTYGTILYTQFIVPVNTYSVGVEGLFTDAVDFATNSASGYPTYTAE